MGPKGFRNERHVNANPVIGAGAGDLAELGRHGRLGPRHRQQPAGAAGAASGGAAGGRLNHAAHRHDQPSECVWGLTAAQWSIENVQSYDAATCTRDMHSTAEERWSLTESVWKPAALHS